MLVASNKCEENKTKEMSFSALTSLFEDREGIKIELISGTQKSGTLLISILTLQFCFASVQYFLYSLFGTAEYIFSTYFISSPYY